MSTPTDITNQQIEALQKALPAEAEVTGQFDQDVRAWTWMVFVPTPTEDDPDLGQGVSRQYVLPEGSDTPDQAVLNGMVTEIAATVAMAIQSQGENQ